MKRALFAVACCLAVSPVQAADVDAALTTRGTHSTAQLSHGLTLPATAMPFGFHFLNPVTDASTWRQAYTWHTPLDDEARPSLQAMALSHTPSPWIGDRGVVQVFPAGADGSATRAGRARAFCHRDEVALPHRYTVTFADGLAIDGAATQHAALLDIRFDPASIAAGPGVVFDQVDDRGELDLSQATKGVLRMVSRGASEETVGSPPVHAIARLRPAPIAASAIPGDGRPSVHGVVRFPPGTRYVTIWLATSFIDPEQAERNLGEVAPDDTVATVAARARDAWRELLSLVRVDSADEEHRVTLASNLYRMFLYPSVTHEIGADGRTRHAVVATDGAVEVRDGERSANNGFWDTYRTIWPALLLLRPREAAQLLDGFVEHFTRDGWTPRWSAPGPVDCMVGTSSDNVIADALAACVDLGDELGAYDSMLRNATTDPASPAVGPGGRDLGQPLFAQKGHALVTHPGPEDRTAVQPLARQPFDDRPKSPQPDRLQQGAGPPPVQKRRHRRGVGIADPERMRIILVAGRRAARSGLAIPADQQARRGAGPRIGPFRRRPLRFCDVRTPADRPDRLKRHPASGKGHDLFDQFGIRTGHVVMIGDANEGTPAPLDQLVIGPPDRVKGNELEVIHVC